MSEVLLKETLECLEGYTERQAALNGVDKSTIESGQKFTINPQTEYVWVNKVASEGILSEVDIDVCTDMVVNDLGFGPSQLVSGRTNTETKERETSGLGKPNGIVYTAVTTNHDTHFTFGELNSFARSKEQFQKRLQDRRLESKREDVERIAWNGVKVAENTDKKTYPLGEDVNIGWLQRMRDHAPEHVITELEGAAIKVGKGQLMENLDQVVVQALSLIPKQYQKGLKVYISSDLLVGRQMKLLEKTTNTETAQKITQDAYYIINGLIAQAPDFFPDGTIFVTRPKNLAIRVQKGSVRSSYEMNSKRDRYENYNQQNEFYALHNYEQAVLIENITLEDAAKE
ncbi:P2 family phage major capsid protein [Wohlfahrtiimonas larvae]|uniref:Phage major capsid protein, P2 family n=1 Tax=Wohlfahrtiimonas larvae TaxID=1157986 RepID=A0ABP9MJ83_9GAMM|nr:P2 family phage major capsid protein [Wohlfahrtiimonas larvae]